MRRPVIASTVAIMGDAAPDYFVESIAPVMELLMNLSKSLFQYKFALPFLADLASGLSKSRHMAAQAVYKHTPDGGISPSVTFFTLKIV